MEDKQKENENYDARLQWSVCDKCNLSCEYCYNHPPKEKSINILATIQLLFPKIKRNIEKISKLSILEIMRIINQKIKEKTGKISDINISALISTLDKTNKIFNICFTGGGEPFLVPNIIEASAEITKKHYLTFVTNLTSKKIKELYEKIDPQKVLWIIASLHIKELERLDLLDVFIHNFLLCKEKGFNIEALEVAYPKLFNEVEKYKEFFKKKGIELKFDRFRGVYNGKRYPDSYTQQELKTFGIENSADLKMSLSAQGKICNAGYNVAAVCTTGDIHLCFHLPKNLGHIYKDIQFKNRLIKCPLEHCHCPFNVYDTYLFEKALKESQIIENNS
ncbi:MAG: hypothetical protein V1923_02740 [Candidatus Omnitrophota bacterium]